MFYYMLSRINAFREIDVLIVKVSIGMAIDDITSNRNEIKEISKDHTTTIDKNPKNDKTNSQYTILKILILDCWLVIEIKILLILFR